MADKIGYVVKMTVADAREAVGDYDNELSDETLEKVSGVFDILHKLSKSEIDNVWSENAEWIVSDVVFGDVTLADLASSLDDVEIDNDVVKGNLLGAALMESKMNDESLLSLTERHELTDYLRHETVLGELSIDEWKSI